MASVMTGRVWPRLERSCGRTADWIRTAPSCLGIERSEAHFAGHGFDPHRHDTYAVGFTIEGVQSFRYRGAQRHCVPGEVFVLHPDEVHDGRAGTEAGFGYRILYIEPRLIRDALGTRPPLPFVREAVSADQRLAVTILPALDDLDQPLEDLHRDQIVLSLAEALAAADLSMARRPPAARHWRAVETARALLDASVACGATSAELEAATGLTRYALARHFRACLGTTPIAICCCGSIGRAHCCGKARRWRRRRSRAASPIRAT